ncbi:MAG: DUF58 domain-containing protein [Planctomycetota bacterium]|nr:DUF58 domain-containing protein [Planctomycetota bacterium]RLS24585.1 MAG: DUF58 domain-containing protein [Planctomycetota bacterium]
MSLIRWIRSIVWSRPPRRILREPWRYRPSQVADVWSRSSVIHFPDTGRALRYRQQMRNLRGNSAGDQTTGHGNGERVAGEFAGYRNYVPGDDPRFIDWRASARTRVPMVRLWEAESQLPVVIVVDVSASLWFEGGESNIRRPMDFVFDVALIIAASALSRQMTVDLLLVSDRVELHLKSLKGRDKLGGIIAELAKFQPKNRQTNWNDLGGWSESVSPGAWVFWVSDFLWLPEPRCFNESFGQFQLRGICARSADNQKYFETSHLKDCETGEMVKARSQISVEEHQNRLQRWSREAGMPILGLSSDWPVPELQIACWLRRGSGNSEG